MKNRLNFRSPYRLPSDPGNTRLSVPLPVELKRRLAAASKALGKSQSEIARDAIEAITDATNDDYGPSDTAEEKGGKI